MKRQDRAILALGTAIAAANSVETQLRIAREMAGFRSSARSARRAKAAVLIALPDGAPEVRILMASLIEDILAGRGGGR